MAASMDERVCQGGQRLWFAVRTNIKSEYKARREIRALGFDAYLPEYKIERFNRRERVAITTTSVCARATSSSKCRA